MRNQDITLADEPESFFDLPTLSYDTSEIEDIIDYFNAAAVKKPVYKWINDLLRATANFRYATVPAGLLFELRVICKANFDLNTLFIEMEQALEKAEYRLEKSENIEDKNILSAALRYCKTSILSRIMTIKSNDPLMKFWKESKLKRHIQE